MPCNSSKDLSRDFSQHLAARLYSNKRHVGHEAPQASHDKRTCSPSLWMDTNCFQTSPRLRSPFQHLLGSEVG